MRWLNEVVEYGGSGRRMVRGKESLKVFEGKRNVGLSVYTYIHDEKHIR
jgi:hypothetical protein